MFVDFLFDKWVDILHMLENVTGIDPATIGSWYMEDDTFMPAVLFSVISSIVVGFIVGKVFKRK